MPEPAVLDHILVAVMVLVSPFYGAWEYRRMVSRLRAGVPDTRAAFYGKAIITDWTFTIGLVAFWLAVQRPAVALGLAVTATTGLVMGIVYVATSSLLWPAILHAAVDLHGGALARHVLDSGASVSKPLVHSG